MDVFIKPPMELKKNILAGINPQGCNGANIHECPIDRSIDLPVGG
jgi:hypothetical protein